MTRLTKISQADLETVNTYLDGALSPKEKAEFEIKLAKSLVLQNTLREYTILRNAIRSIPPKKAPHHFTLTTAEAQEARIQRKLFLAPIFSFASLVTVMLLAIVFAGDWIFKNMSAPAAPAPMEAPIAARASEPTEEASVTQDLTDIPLIFNWGSGQVAGFGMGGGGDMAKSMSGYSGNPEVVNPSVLAAPAEGQLMSAQPTEGEPNTTAVEPPSAAVPAPLTSAEIPADYAGAIIWGLQPDSEGQIIEVYPTATDIRQPQAEAAQLKTDLTSQETAQTEGSIYQTSPWVKYTLAGLTLLFGLLAYIFNRRLN